ncbi:MAG: hypothetical protein AAF697_07970 [Pseudomonadota bacterium]
MDVSTLILQTAGSLVAIFALYLLARALKLGGKPRLGEAITVHRVAAEVEDGFLAARVSIARKGNAALTADSSGRIMLIKRHGNRFSGRVLTSAAKVREEVDGIVVDCGEARFGEVRLSIDDPAYWVDAINRL